MPISNKPIFPQTITTGATQIAPADTTSLKTLYTAGVNGSRIDNILATSTDTAARDLQFVITIDAVDYVLGTLSCLANSGFTNAVAILPVLSDSKFAALSQDGNGNKVLFLASGAVLKVKSLTTVTAAKVISVLAQGADF